MNNKSKNIRIDSNLEKEVSALCEILHTNFSHKTKELLFNWKIEAEKKLKQENPELYKKYLQKLK